MFLKALNWQDGIRRVALRLRNFGTERTAASSIIKEYYIDSWPDPKTSRIRPAERSSRQSLGQIIPTPAKSFQRRNRGWRAAIGWYGLIVSAPWASGQRDDGLGCRCLNTRCALNERPLCRDGTADGLIDGVDATANRAPETFRIGLFAGACRFRCERPHCGQTGLP